MNDDEFNSVLHKLPFLFKLDVNAFYTALDELKRGESTTIQQINLFYTLYAIGRISCWFNHLLDILPNVGHDMAIELCKMVLFHKIDPADILRLLTYMFTILKSEHDVMSLCFMNAGFFKPIASSHIRTFKSIPKETLQLLIELVLQHVSEPDNLVFVFERILSFRPLSESEEQKLESIHNVGGKYIDILLRTGIPKFIAKAHTLTQESEPNVLLKEHGAHYFKVDTAAVDVVNSARDDIINSVAGAMSLVNKFETSENLFACLNLILTSGYKDASGLTLEKVFDFMWQTCNDEQKIILLQELNSYDAICCSGFLINLLSLAGSLFDKTFLTVDNVYITRQAKIDALKLEYPPEDDIWLDNEKLAILLA